MAIIWMDGPDHYGTNQGLLTQGPYAQASNGNQSVLIANAGPGGVGTVFNQSSGTIRKVLPGVRAMVGIGARWIFFSLPTTNGVCRLYEFRNILNEVVAYIVMISTGALELRTGAGALLYRTDPVISASSWQHIEVRVGENALDGISFAIGVDSVTVFSSDTILDVDMGVAQISMTHDSLFHQQRFRDLYIWDSLGDENNQGMQGDRQVFTRFPTADGPEQDWTPSTGVSGWPLVSNVPPNDGQYVMAALPGDKSNFQFGDIDTDITSISALMVVGRLKKSDAGIGTFSLGVESGATTEQGLEQAAATEWKYFNTIFTTDPDTDLKWTPGGVNDALVNIIREE